MLSYSWGMTSNKRGCEAQTPSLVPPIEASPLLIYSHFGRPNGGVRRPSPNEVSRMAGSGDPRRTKSAERRGQETLAERSRMAGSGDPRRTKSAERRGQETLAERSRTAGSGDPRRTKSHPGIAGSPKRSFPIDPATTRLRSSRKDSEFTWCLDRIVALQVTGRLRFRSHQRWTQPK